MTVFRCYFAALILWFATQAIEAYAWRLEAGDVTTINTASTAVFTNVTFQNTFDVVPVVVVLPTDQGSDSASLRIRNVTTSGFEVVPVEATGNDGPHTNMTIHYVAIEPGNHTLPDGVKIAAGTHPTTTVQSKFIPSGWDLVSFGSTLDSTASVVATIQTLKSEVGFTPSGPSSPFLTVATRNASASSIEVALERSEDTSGTVAEEDIGWIAFPSGSNGTFIDTLDGMIGWDARITSDTVVGWGNGCTTHTFSSTSWTNARVFGTKNRRDGVDGGWVRRCSLSGTEIGLVIDEDIANDTERNHTNESVALLALSDSFHANFEGKLDANKTVSVTSGGYALPGSIVAYTIETQSSGALPVDDDAVVLIDNLPPEVALRLVDIDGPGSGPVLFDDGSPVSGLTYTYLGLTNTSDDLEFSDNGGASFDYDPIDDGSGSDPDVTHIRINPKGSFLERSTAGNPKFEIVFEAVIK
ncbi:MAG: H-type lectin domain-containing protein [Litorimonas sp.]